MNDVKKAESPFATKEMFQSIQEIYQRLTPSQDGSPAPEYQITPLGNKECVIRVKGQQQDSTLLLHVMEPYKQRKSTTIRDVHGEIFRANGEWLRFFLRLSVPSDTDTLNITEDSIVAFNGVSVSPAGEVSQFADKNAEIDKHSKECGACKTMPAQYLYRRVGENRCWLCSSVALVLGLMVTTGAALGSTPFLSALGVQDTSAISNFARIVLGGGVLYTAWRVWFWGYLPYQNWVVWKLELRKRKRVSQESSSERRDHVKTIATN